MPTHHIIIRWMPPEIPSMTLAEKDALNRSREKAEKLTLVLEDKLDRE